MMTVSFRPFVASDVVAMDLQVSQHVTLGISRPVHSIEDGEELADGNAEAWTAIDDSGRVLACAGLKTLWPAGPKSGGHALAWALLASGIGAGHLAITRFFGGVIAASPLTRIEAIVRSGVAAEGRWARQVGLTRSAPLEAYGPEAEDHELLWRIKPLAGGQG